MKNKESGASVRPVVSIVMPVLNGERWLHACLSSLRNQSFQDYEIILVDDGCTDSSLEIALSMDFESLRIVQGQGNGVGSALAQGVEVAKAPFVARQDADDLSDPLRLEKQLAYMIRYPNCVAVGSWAYQINENGKILQTMKTPMGDRSIKLAMNFNCPFIHTSVTFRREAVLKAGNYRPGNSRVFAEDYDLWSRLAPLGEFHNIQEPLVSYRLNPHGVTGTNLNELYRSGSAIAIQNTERRLGRKLSKEECELFSFYFIRHRRINLRESFMLYKITAQLLWKTGFPPPSRGLSWFRWFAPIIWIVHSPRHVT